MTNSIGLDVGRGPTLRTFGRSLANDRVIGTLLKPWGRVRMPIAEGVLEHPLVPMRHVATSRTLGFRESAKSTGRRFGKPRGLSGGVAPSSYNS